MCHNYRVFKNNLVLKGIKKMDVKCFQLLGFGKLIKPEDRNQYYLSDGLMFSSKDLAEKWAAANGFVIAEIRERTFKKEWVDWCDHLANGGATNTSVYRLFFPINEKGERIPLKCEDCGTTEGVSVAPCPYDEDVNNRITLVALCAKCDYERAMDI